MFKFFEIEVVNKYKDPVDSNTFYVGRGSKLGNYRPNGLDKTQAIRWFKNQTESGLSSDQKDYLNKIWAHGRKFGVVKLQCFCAPKACHAEVIREILFEKQRELFGEKES